MIFDIILLGPYCLPGLETRKTARRKLGVTDMFWASQLRFKSPAIDNLMPSGSLPVAPAGDRTKSGECPHSPQPKRQEPPKIGQ